MATAGDGRAPYESGGAGGKFRKRPFRRSVPATPYDRPPTALRNTNPGLLTRLVDPASRLLYAGAHRLFGVLRKRLPPIQGPPEINEEALKVPQEAVRNSCSGVSEPSPDQGGNTASISAATGIADLEQMLKQKTFTRSEIQRLTALLQSRTIESPSDDVVERDGAKPSSSPFPLLRLEASTSGSLKKHGDERDNFHADISTPVVSSRVLEEEIASPAELAKAYMGSRPAKVAPSALGFSSQALRQDSKLLNDASGLPKTPIATVASKTANSLRGLENGFFTPRSRGRSAMYSMARAPYSRGPSNFSQQAIKSDYGHGAPLTSSPWGHEGKMALKRRSSVLEDDIGSGGPLRRTRQKANLMSQGSSMARDKRELGYGSLQQPDAASQKLLLMNKPEPTISKELEENGDTSMRGSAYASVPTKSSQMADKILRHLDRLTPTEKKSGSTLAGTSDKSPTKLTPNMLHGQALRSLEKVDSPKFLPSPHESEKLEDQRRARLHEVHEPTSQFKGKDKVEVNSSRKFPIPCNMLTSVNGDSRVPLKDNAHVVTTIDSTSKLPAEPPQKKRAFQMSAHEDSFDLDDDIHVNGHVSFPAVENHKPEASFVASKPHSAEVIKTPSLPEVSTPPALTEVTPVLPEVAKISEQSASKEAENATSTPKTDAGFLGGSVNEQGVGFKFLTTPPSTSPTQTSVPPQSTLQMEKVAPEKGSNAFSLFGNNTEKVSPIQFSVSEPSEFKPKAGSDPKAPESTSLFGSVTKNDHGKLSAFNKDENGNDQKPANIFGKSECLPSAVHAASSSGFFSFGIPTNNSSTSNAMLASSPPMFSSSTPFPASGGNMNSFFNNGSSKASTASGISATATTASTATAISATTTAAASGSLFSTSVPAPVFSTSVPAPAFSFGSAIATPPTSVADTGNTNATNGKDPKSNISSSSFTTTTTTSSLFGFSSPATTSTTNSQSQVSFFNATSGSQASTAVTQAAPFQFPSSTPSIASTSAGISSSASASSLFGSSAPAFGSTPSFGISSAASTETKSGSSTSGFGSAWQPPKSSGFGSTFSSPSPVFSFGAPSASSSPMVFGSSNTGASTGSSMFSFSAGAANSFGAPSQGQPVFGSPAPVFGNPTSSPNNNDQMSMEDSMAEDSMQTPGPSVPTFGQAPAAAPGFMFGSATPAAAAAPFQFGGQPSQTPPQNPFQSSSVEFGGGGGSFSLGSGGGDKSGRRIVRVKNKNRRK